MTQVTSEKIAEKVISSMGSQMDLLFTISVAICGGIIALIVQIILHKTKDTHILNRDH